jgi:multicomponent Na+:H+ antiporter subunit D
MTTILSHLPALQVVVPLIAAMVIALMRSGRLAWALTTLATWLALINAVLLAGEAFGSREPISYVMGGWSVPIGIEFRVDRLNAFVIVLVAALAAIILPYALRSVAHEIRPELQSGFYAMYLLALAGLFGVAITGDAFNAFVFLEVSSLATYVLIAMGRHRRALLASYQYLIMGTIGATLYVIGIGILYLVTGTLNFADIASRLPGQMAEFDSSIVTAFAFLTVGISLKLALFPLHVWLPNAYAYAPSVATAFLAGTATKVAIYLLVRIFFSVFGVSISFETLPVGDVLLVLSVAAMLIASTIAVFEQNGERMLAYSSVAQVGYITLGIALANQSGLTGGLVHIINHAVIKTALFLALGAVVYRTGSSLLPNLSGIGRRMPLTMAAFVVAGLGLIGVPGTAGFISKWYLVLGALEADNWVLVAVIVASSLIAVLYVGRVIEVAYFREPSADLAAVRDPPLTMLVPIWLVAAASIVLGLYTDWSVGVCQQVAEYLLAGGL